MSERQEPYVTATATPISNCLKDAEVMVLSKREREFIERWRKNPKAAALAVDPAMARLWDKLCRCYALARKREIEPIGLIDFIRLALYTANDA